VQAVQGVEKLCHLGEGSLGCACREVIARQRDGLEDALVRVRLRLAADAQRPRLRLTAHLGETPGKLQLREARVLAGDPAGVERRLEAATRLAERAEHRRHQGTPGPTLLRPEALGQLLQASDERPRLGRPVHLEEQVDAGVERGEGDDVEVLLDGFAVAAFEQGETLLHTAELDRRLAQAGVRPDALQVSGRRRRGVDGPLRQCGHRLPVPHRRFHERQVEVHSGQILRRTLRFEDRTHLLVARTGGRALAEVVVAATEEQPARRRLAHLSRRLEALDAGAQRFHRPARVGRAGAPEGVAHGTEDARAQQRVAGVVDGAAIQLGRVGIGMLLHGPFGRADPQRHGVGMAVGAGEVAGHVCRRRAASLQHRGDAAVQP
jgi:hypothetical protein